MEMESSRRSMDRSRELGIKKARIGEDAERDRGFNRVAERERSLDRPAQRGSPLLERFRAIEREREGDRERGRGRAGGDEETADRENDREDSVQGGQQQQQHELVNQYKTALGELTFNSKPIITNLTIIAGENSHAAKGIAATVCAHILEVPNEQKLPSLYLLDSIVKNIGGDYVKYFAGRLPEVFCKAYRQVDPATHPGMQHLFRTWRGVFPPVPLRIIEEELQFPPSVNGSSSGTTTPRSSDSQSQRPGHSIHVNPKYLEARQRLQQSSRFSASTTKDSPETGLQAEGANSENNEDEPIQETERSERTMRESPKGWSEAPPLKRSNAPRPPRGDAFSEPGYGQKPAAGYADYDLGSDRARPSEMGMGRPNNRVVERDNGLERPWYGEGLGELESSTSSVTYGQRNGYEWQQPPTRGPLVDAYGNYRVPGSVRGPLPHLMPPQDIASRNNRVMSRNWQNSEEEEYMWEDMSTRLVDHGRGSDKSRKEDWFPGDMDKPLGLARGKRMGPEPDLPDSNWRSLGPLSQMDQPMGGEERIPLRRELDDHLSSSLLQHDVGARSGRDTSVETTSILRTAQTALGHRSLPGWLSHRHLSLPPQSRPRALPTDPSNHASLVSLNVGQSEGKAVTSLNGGLSTNIVPPSGLRTNFRTNIGLPPSTGPLNFGSLPLVTPVSSGMSSRQRQSQRPPSPSSQPSIQQLPCSSPSALPRQQPVQLVQHQQQRNFIKPDYLQGQALPPHPSQLVQQVPQPPSQIQQVPHPQSAPDSLHQLPHNHAQSGHSLQLLHMPQQIQSLQHFQNPASSAAPSQQGHQVQFSQQLQPEPPQQIQPVSLSHQTYSQSLMQTHPLQQVELRSLPQLPPPSFGPPQTMGHATSGISTNPSPPLQGQTSTQNLLAAIFQSGLFPSNSGQVASNPQPASPKGFSDFGSSQPLMHIQPPLPSGPPPVQFSTSTAISLPLPPVVPLPVPTPVTSLSGPIPGSALVPPPPNNLSMLPSQPMRMVQPPLPPGPPPASSLVGATSQSTNAVATQPSSVNPLSNLLNSLVAKGLISASSESASSSLSLSAVPSVANQLPGHNTGFAASNPGQAAVSVPFSGAAVLSTSTAIHPIPASAAEAQVVKDPIGVEFKLETIRERHASVINVLYDDFPRQCRTCGLRLKSQEEHSKHMDWHASRNHEQKLQKKASRKWFPSMKGWLGGTSVSPCEVSPFSVKETNLQTEDNEHSAVPADENQSVCALCGEPFEDFYSDETEEWMYKGAVYMNAPPGGTIGSLDSSLLGPIVHVKCRSESTAVSLDDSEEDDVDEEDGLGCRRKTIWY